MHARPLLLLFIFCLLTVACSLAEDVPKGPPAKIAVDAPAPDFRLQDLKSREVTLGGLRGRPVLLVFGTTWCPYCREEIPRIKEIYAKGRGKNLEVLNIYVNESEKKVGEFAARHALPYPVLLDRDGKVAERYQVRGVPMIVLVDGQGTIQCYQCRNFEAMLETLRP
jgi:peroxiredoxin